MSNGFPLAFLVSSACTLFGAAYFMTEGSQRTNQANSTSMNYNLSLEREKEKEKEKEKEETNFSYTHIENVQIAQALSQIGVSDLESLPKYPILLFILKEISKYTSLDGFRYRRTNKEQNKKLREEFEEIVLSCETMCLITDQCKDKIFLDNFIEVKSVVAEYQQIFKSATQMVHKWSVFEEEHKEYNKKRLEVRKKMQNYEEKKKESLIFDDADASNEHEDIQMEWTEEEKAILEEEEQAEELKKRTERLEMQRSVTGQARNLTSFYNPLFELRRLKNLQPDEKRRWIKDIFEEKTKSEILQLYFEVLCIKLQEECFSVVFSKFGIPQTETFTKFIQDKFKIQINSFEFQLPNSSSSSLLSL